MYAAAVAARSNMKQHEACSVFSALAAHARCGQAGANADSGRPLSGQLGLHSQHCATALKVSTLLHLLYIHLSRLQDICQVYIPIIVVRHGLNTSFPPPPLPSMCRQYIWDILASAVQKTNKAYLHVNKELANTREKLKQVRTNTWIYR